MISSVCWPGVGTGPIRPGVFDILTVTPGKYISPATGSSISQISSTGGSILMTSARRSDRIIPPRGAGQLEYTHSVERSRYRRHGGPV